MFYIILILIIVAALYSENRLRKNLEQVVIANEQAQRDNYLLSELAVRIATKDKKPEPAIKQLIALMGNLPMDTYNRTWANIANRYGILLEEIQTEDGNLVLDKATQEKAAKHIAELI